MHCALREECMKKVDDKKSEIFYNKNMNRNVAKGALVISVRTTAQDNRSVCVITQDGIEFSTLFGGPKSRLSGAVSPWNSGTMYFYNNAEKASSKITDFDVKKYHPTFRESLFKSFAAALAGEIVVKSKCAGNGKAAFVLLNGFLDGMDLCDEKSARLGLLRFLWRYIDLLGIRPETKCCALCSKEFGFSSENHSAGNYFENVIQFKANGGAFFLPEQGGFLCEDCAGAKYESGVEGGRRLSFEQLFYLDLAGGENLSAARNVPLSERAQETLKAFLFQMTENALGQRLKTISTGNGIL